MTAEARAVHWGSGGERVTVLGRGRHSRRWFVVDMSTRHLYNFRPALVPPRVLELLRERPHRGFDEESAASSTATLEQCARRYRAEAGGAAPHPDGCRCHRCLTGEASPTGSEGAGPVRGPSVLPGTLPRWRR